MESHNVPVIDPTANVLSLVEAAVKRLDDLISSEVKRMDDLRNAENRRVDELMSLHDAHSRDLQLKESARLDAIRQVDVQNQAAASKSALDAIQALASTTTINAENIRNALNTTAQQMAKQTSDLAATIATQTAATNEALASRIAALEKAAAEGVGKQRVTDPMMEDFITEIKQLVANKASDTGDKSGKKELLGWIVSGVMLLIAIATFFYSKLWTH